MSDAKKDKPGTEPDTDDVREQMRLALERKKAGAHGGPSHADGSGSKASAATANAKVSREFRRKSGG